MPTQPRHITLASLDVFQTGCETLGFEVALALVPVFGPITLVDSYWGAFFVDGSGDAAALVAERAKRVQAFGSAMAEDLGEKIAVYSNKETPS